MELQGFLAEALGQYRRYKEYAERAAAQVSDEDFFRTLDPESTSIAVIMKHLAGNHRSRWRDFLTSDGEKPDRRRDGEFQVHDEGRPAIEARWQEAWQITFESLESLSEGDLQRTITIRGEPHSVLQAVARNLTHLAYHVGQIVWLARHFAGPSWQTLSIPRGKSEEYNRRVWGGGAK